MKNKVICLLSVLFLLASPAAHAGFWIKKQTVETTADAATAGKVYTNAVALTQEIKTVMHDRQAKYMPAHSFDNMRGMGLLSTLSVLCGVIGFFFPFFSLAAVLLGFMGITKKNSKRGLAVAGLVLGLIVIGLVVFGTFTGFPLY